MGHIAGQTGMLAWADGVDQTQSQHSSQIAAKLDTATAAATYVPLGSLVLDVKDYGAKGDGSTDDTAAIQAAINAAQSAGRGVVFLPAGNYHVSATLTIASATVNLIGAGVSVTTITMTTTTGTLISVSDSAGWVRVTDMTLTRTSLATSGAGIATTSSYSGSEVQYHTYARLHVTNHAVGLDLGPATQGFVYDVVCESNNGPGVRMTASAATGTMQWDLVNILSQANNSHGFHVYAPGTGAPQIVLGQWLRCKTYANSGHGVYLQGASACPISDFRCSDSFFGEDASSEVSLDTYGGGHHIVNTFTEYSGAGATGVGLATPATGSGSGLELFGSNIDVTIVGGVDSVNSSAGIVTSAQRVTITGRHFVSNGSAGGTYAGTISGVYNTGSGRLTMTGCAAWGQKYGVYTDVDSVLIVGNDLSGNTTAATGASVTLTASVVANNLTV